jgi:hypothetical protein
VSGVYNIIFDSGASRHMLYTNVSMYNYRGQGGKASLGDKSTVDIAGKGDTDLISGVLHVPMLSYGLISISALDDKGCISLFRRGRVWVVSPTGEVVCSGTKRDNLYHLDVRYREALFGEREVVDGSHLAAAAKHLSSTTLGYNELELFHHRWGHAKEQSIKQAYCQRKVKDCDCEGVMIASRTSVSDSA